MTREEGEEGRRGTVPSASFSLWRVSSWANSLRSRSFASCTAQHTQGQWQMGQGPVSHSIHTHTHTHLELALHEAVDEVQLAPRLVQSPRCTCNLQLPASVRAQRGGRGVRAGAREEGDRKECRTAVTTSSAPHT